MPVLIDETKGKDGNPWAVSLMAMFHMSNDSGLFHTASQLRARGYVHDGVDWIMPGMTPKQSGHNLRSEHSADASAMRYVPLYEAKMISIYDHRFGSYPDGHVDDTRALPRLSDSQLADPCFEILPRYWVPEVEVTDRLATRGWTTGWLMGWRDITNTNNERTVIAAAFPRVAVGNNLPLMLFDSQFDPHKLAALIGSLSSLTCDYFARHKVGGTHLNYFIYQQLAVLPPAAYDEGHLAYIVPRVLELTYTSNAMAPFARDLGYDDAPFAWDEDRRAQLRAELDAWYARAYGLTRDELRYVLDPADVKGPDYPSETFRVLKKNEIARVGEYRTARLVLAAYDQLMSQPLAAE